MYIYRDAIPGEEKEILNIIGTVLSEYGLSLEPNGADFDVSDINKYYFSNNGWFQVVEKDNKIVGSVCIYKINDTTCELRKMYLLNEHQGIGIGKELLKNALTAAKKLNYNTITLQTNSLLIKALPLYEQYGFINDYNGDVCSRCDIAMKKTL